MLVWLSRLPVGSSASNKRRLVDQRAGDGHALLLPAGKLVGMMIGALARPTISSACVARSRCSRAGDAAMHVKHRQLDIFQRGRAREQIEALENKADFLVADVRQLIAVQSRNIHAIQQIMSALVGRSRQPMHVHQGGFARTARAHDRHEFAALNFQRDAAHGVDIHFAGVVNLVDILE